MNKWLFGALFAISANLQAQTTLLEQLCETRTLNQQLTVTADKPVVITHHSHGRMLTDIPGGQVDIMPVSELLVSGTSVTEDCLAYLQQSDVLRVKPGDDGVLARVYFTFDRAALSDTSLQILDRVAGELRKNPGLVTLEGHTDSKGPASYNMALGLKRSKTVEQYLIQKGLDPTTLQAISRGESRPAADNASADGREKNRRVEVRI